MQQNQQKMATLLTTAQRRAEESQKELADLKRKANELEDANLDRTTLQHEVNELTANRLADLEHEAADLRTTIEEATSTNTK